MKLKGKILLLVLVPILILGACTYAICSVKVTEAMKENIQQNLKAASIILKGEITGGEDAKFQVKGGKLYYGDKNITDDTDAVDELKEETDIVATVFYGDTRYMSSILDPSTGKPIIGTKASQAITEEVLEGGKEYFVENVEIEGSRYFAYYCPLYDSSSKQPAGMVFLGMNQGEVEDQIGNILMIILSVIIAIAVILAVLAIIITGNISKRIIDGIKSLEQVANGDLTVSISGRSKKSKDETGEMNQAIEKLRDNLSDIVNEIKSDSSSMHEFSVDLSANMKEASETIGQVEIAVGEVAEGATAQASDTLAATQDIVDMGHIIEDTGREVVSLNENADFMYRSGTDADKVLGALEEISNKTKKAIEEIYHQTNTTNRAAVKIREATVLITSIAEETNLLSLNASIEAARAGEAGRGFAVVADQIQRLAEQSTDSAKQIEDIVNELISDSEKAVETMDEVKTIVDEQNVKIDMTSEIFGQVKAGIDKSMDSINLIDEKTKVLDQERERIVDIVQNLSAIAQENAASTEETSAAVTEVSAAITEISERSEDLENIAAQLKKSVSSFKI